MHANKVLVGATGTIVGEGFHKTGSVSPEGIRPTTGVGVLTKGLQLPNGKGSLLVGTRGAGWVQLAAGGVSGSSAASRGSYGVG